ncbi:hypothetical protein Tco_1218996 [Tanacetum coccineum]
MSVIRGDIPDVTTPLVGGCASPLLSGSLAFLLKGQKGLPVHLADSLCPQEESYPVMARNRMLHIITLLAMASAVALGIFLAYVPYEEEFQYLAFILAILVPLIVLAIGVDLFWKE